MGGSTVRALRQLAGPDLELVVGGRSKGNFLKSVEVSIIYPSCERARVQIHLSITFSDGSAHGRTLGIRV